MCAPVPVAPGRIKQEKTFSASEVFLVSLVVLVACAFLGFSCFLIHDTVQMNNSDFSVTNSEMYQQRIGRNAKGPRFGFGFGHKITGGIGWGFVFQ